MGGEVGGGYPVRHTNFHNDDCKMCRVMELITWGLAGIGVLVFVYLVAKGDINQLPADDRPEMIFATIVGFVVSLWVWKYLRKFLPQSHGYLMDATGDTSWYKPRSKK